MGARCDRIHEIALVLYQAQSALEMRLAGMLLKSFAQNADTLVQVRLDLNLSIDLGDQGRQFLPLLLLDVIAEGLKYRIGRILRQIGLAGGDGFGKIAIRELLARLRVSGVHRIVLGTHFVIKALVAGATFAIDGVGCFAVKLEHDA